MYKIRLLFPLATLFLSTTAFAQIYQFGTVMALLNGIYSSDIPFTDVKKVGSFGLGTDEGLGGELIEVNSKFYLANYGGGTTQLSLTTKTPFFMTTSFQKSQKCIIPDINNLTDFENKVTKCMNSKNYYYAIKITGLLSTIKARAVKPAQKPYHGLSIDVKDIAKITDYKNIKGTLVGFYSPTFVRSVSVPGFHFHFLSDDLLSGGHVFDFSGKNLEIEISKSPTVSIRFPTEPGYANANLSENGLDSLIKVEKNTK